MGRAMEQPMSPPISKLGRRTVLQGAAGALALPALSRTVLAAPPPAESPVLMILYLNGGPPGLFNSAKSFLSKGAFGVTTENVRALSKDFLVDAGTFGSLPSAALGHMAAVNFKHN